MGRARGGRRSSDPVSMNCGRSRVIAGRCKLGDESQLRMGEEWGLPGTTSYPVTSQLSWNTRSIRATYRMIYHGHADIDLRCTGKIERKGVHRATIRVKLGHRGEWYSIISLSIRTAGDWGPDAPISEAGEGGG